jgi:hypothetical protein
VDEWLTRARDVLAAEAGVDSAALVLSDDDIETLLDLARIAAHASGERTNAPLLCYLVGRAQGMRPLSELAEPLSRLKS